MRRPLASFATVADSVQERKNAKSDVEAGGLQEPGPRARPLPALACALERTRCSWHRGGRRRTWRPPVRTVMCEFFLSPHGRGGGREERASIAKEKRDLQQRDPKEGRRSQRTLRPLAIFAATAAPQRQDLLALILVEGDCFCRRLRLANSFPFFAFAPRAEEGTIVSFQQSGVDGQGFPLGPTKQAQRAGGGGGVGAVQPLIVFQ